MPTDDPRDHPAGAAPGFQSYADDTPREPDAWSPAREPRTWDDATYAEFEEPMRAERIGSAVWPKVAVGVAVLAAFGGGFLLAGNDRPTTATPRPASEAAAMAAARPMNVELAQAAPVVAPPPSATTKLEVLPPTSGQATTPVFRRAPTGRPAQAAPAPVLISPAPPPQAPMAPSPPPPREVAAAPVARDAATVEPARPSFDCRDAPTLAREMVCSDRELAAMDRRMKQAYSAALAAGAPENELAADQADWLDIREEAAHRSRRSVANIYNQRIEELRAAADRPWR